MEKLKENGVPIHALYIDEKAKKNFEEMANETGGVCQKLDINSSDGEILLTDMITEQILRTIQEQRGLGDALTRAYSNLRD